MATTSSSPPFVPPLKLKNQSIKMSWRKPWQKKMELFSFSFLPQPFYLLSITTLTLLLPLSFLLLSRLSTPNFFHIQTNPSNPLLFSFIFSTNPSILHLLVSIITTLSLFHTLTGRVALPGRTELHAAWVLLCSVQVCVIIGIQASMMETGPNSGYGSGPGSGLGLFSRAVFFVGMHETMMCWSRSVVRPVVDDSMWGGARAERWTERVVVTVACGALWWLRLREEVDALVEMVDGGGIGDFVGWWLYYLTVSIGMARVLRGAIWVVMVVFYKRFEDAINGGGDHSLDVGVEEQV